MTGSSDEEFLLKWHDHHTSFFLLAEELVTREQLTDVTLSCGDMILNAHSLMLSVCSPYFRSLLSENQHREKHHIIHLNGVSGRLMQQLLVYMYRGEISISQDDLGPLIETARCLQIKGLSMANTDVDSTKLSSKKRSASQTEYPLSSLKTKERKLFKKLSPVKSGAVSPSFDIKATTDEEFIKDEEEYSLVDYPEFSAPKDCPSTNIKEVSTGKELTAVTTPTPTTPLPFPLVSPVSKELVEVGKPGPPSNIVALPLLPKPLSILKTAETRTYLSKLIWLGNGGKRPQYGNPETKPLWWPQHVLPWEEMKKMGGRKSQELSHINYTEILKQCLAAGYEYFGYDPSTYFSSEPPEIQMSDISFSSIDDHSYEDFISPPKGGGASSSSGVTPNTSTTTSSVPTITTAPPNNLVQIHHQSAMTSRNGATSPGGSTMMEVESSDGCAAADPTSSSAEPSSSGTGIAVAVSSGGDNCDNTIVMTPVEAHSGGGGATVVRRLHNLYRRREDSPDDGSGDGEPECEPAPLQIDLSPASSRGDGRSSSAAAKDKKSNRLQCDKDQILCK